VDCLHKLFLFDTQKFLSKERAETLMMPLVDQVFTNTKKQFIADLFFFFPPKGVGFFNYQASILSLNKKGGTNFFSLGYRQYYCFA